MSEINVVSRTQRLLVDEASKTVSVINGGPMGPGVGGPGIISRSEYDTDQAAQDAAIAANAAAIAAIFPRNTIITGLWSTDPLGFLILDGSTVTGGAITYADLAADHPSWVSGNDLILPNVDGRTFMFDNASPGVLAGSMTHTLSTAQLPSHDHTINHGHADNFTTANDTHNHSYYAAGVNKFVGNAIQTDAASVRSYTTTTSDTHNHVINGQVTDHTGNSGATGSGDAVDHTPAHLTVRAAIKY